MVGVIQRGVREIKRDRERVVEERGRVRYRVSQVR